MGRYIADDLIEEIRISNDIVDVVSQYVKLERKGKHMFGLCPFHREKTPSFSVTQSKQMYYCYSCGKGGNVFHFIKEMENLDFIEAVEFLARRVGIEIPDTINERDIKANNLKKEIIGLNVHAARFFYDNLVSDKGSVAREYLRKRGMTENTIRRFGMGFSTASWDELYKSVKDKFSDEAIQQSGLILKNKNGGFFDRFRARIMFPIFNIRGEVIGFGGRIMDDTLPKYLNSPETLVYSKRKNLYALNFAKRYSEKRLIIVEGYMDAVSLHQAGIKNVVASLGTAFTDEQARLIKKYTKEVVLSYDMDNAGQNATLRAIKILEDASIPVKILTIPEGKDPDEFIKKYGKDVFENLVDKAQTAFEYRIQRLKESIDLNNIDGKVKFLNEVAKILSNVYNNLEREIYIKKIAQDYEISQDAIEKEIRKLSVSNNAYSGLKLKKVKDAGGNLIKKSNKDDELSHYEKMILVLLANDNSLFWKIEKELNEIKIKDQKTKQILDSITDKIKRQEGIVFSELLNMVQDDVASNYVSIYEEECNFENNEKAILDIIRKIRLIMLKEEQHEIIKKMSDVASNDKELQLTLKQELNEILNKIKKLKR